jgi:PTH1 family peptidyl-tRNA hydrolase
MTKPGQNFRKKVYASKYAGSPADLLVIGLGNPGDEYAHTRHNAGQDAVELLAQRFGVSLKKAMGVAYWGQTRVDGKLLAIGLPGTYMNLSGEGTAPLVRRYGIDDLTKLVVIHDEVDLPLGRIQVKVGGGLAGHNGLKSIKHHLKDDGFTRIRIGVDKPDGRQPVADWVLKRPSKEDQATFAQAIADAADAVETILREGPTTAMNRHNS